MICLSTVITPCCAPVLRDADVLSEGDIQRVIDSIADNEAYLAFNCAPVAQIIQILTDSFDPAKPQDPFSLQLHGRPRKLFSSFR